MDKEPTLENSSNLTITKSQITGATVIDAADVDNNPNGFSIHINDGHSSTWYLRAESPREKKSWLMRLGHVHVIVRWLEDFEKIRVLGVGGTGIVYELLHKTNGSRYAMKEMEIKNKPQMEMALQEAGMLKDIMENISHPNVMHIEKVFQVGSKFYLVFPLCTGGELYEHIIRRGHYTERDAAVVFRDIISGLDALHSHDILHLDIKPENILFESMEPDAKIKITDFGLSKMFNSSDSDSGVSSQSSSFNSVSMDEMNKKLKAFQDSGVLNREALRGTVGYMSPELILLGASSKATDIFAAGVVLYILLCGRPPFHSKSNREVLERTARGAYRMTGEEWEDISKEAKDLVKRMLVVDPSKRITTTEILKHPWLAFDNDDNEDDEDQFDDTNTGIGADKEDPAATPLSPTQQQQQDGPISIAPKVSLSGGRKRSTGSTGSANLSKTLHMLSGHVNSRRSEKLATSFTRLMSSLQHANGKSSVLIQLVRPIGSTPPSQTGASTITTAGSAGQLGTSHTGGLIPAIDANGNEEFLLMLNPDIRLALSSAINKVGDEPGKLSIEQLMCILRHFGLAPNNNNITTTGTDTAATNNSNVAAVGAASSSSSSATAATGPNNGLLLLLCRFIDRDGDGYISTDDIFTTQALVAQRSEVFLKAVFRMYLESVWYPGRQLNLMHLMRAPKRRTSGVGSKVLEDLSTANQDIVEPPKFITGRHVASVFERLGYDPSTGQMIFNSLSDALTRARRRQQEEQEESERGSEVSTISNAVSSPQHPYLPPPPAQVPAPSSTLVQAHFLSEAEENAMLESGGAEENIIQSLKRLELNEKASTTSSSTTSAPSSVGGFKMDVNDFVKACEMDDVLIQVLLYRSRNSMAELVKKAEQKMSDSSSSGNIHRQKSIDATSSLLEEELITALKALTVESKPHFPIANAVGRATLSAAIGYAANFTMGARVVLEAAYEGMEGFESATTAGDGGEAQKKNSSTLSPKKS